MSRLRLLLGHPTTQLPTTQTVAFGVKTRVGHGGYPLGYQGTGTLSITAGNSSAHWQIDNRNHLIPKNGAGAYGTVGPTFSGPYTLTVTDGLTNSIVTVNIVAAAAHMREMYSTPSGTNQDTASSFQLATLLALAQGVAGAMELGDTIYGRDGIFNAPSVSALNQGGAAYRVRPPLPVSTACWATGSGGYSSNTRIQITSDTQYTTQTDANGNYLRGGGFVCGGLSFDAAVSGDASYPIDFNYVTFYFNGTTGGVSLLSYNSTSQGYGVSAYYCRFELGLSVPDAQVFKLSAMVSHGSSVTDHCYIKRLRRGVSGGGELRTSTGNIFTTRSTTITWNVFDTMYEDACTLTGVNLAVQYNHGFNWRNYPTAHPDMVQHLGFQDGVAHTDFGEVSYNTSVRNVGTVGRQDVQGSAFFDDTASPATIAGAAVKNNISNTTYGNGIYLTRFNGPVCNFNTVLKDFSADSGATGNAATPIITVATGKGGTDATFLNNLVNGINIAAQGGTVTNTNTVTLAKTSGAYNGALAAYVAAPLATRAQAIAAFAAKVNGTAKNGDGTYSGALFPVNNFGEVGWNDGTVWSASTHYTQAI